MVVVLYAGCWSGAAPAPAVTQPLANTAPVTAQPPPGARRTVWEGQYTCRQGETALRLSLERNAERVDATFEFGPLATNPTVPRGAFLMTGTATRDADGVTVELTPTEWIERPSNYVMVGLHATITEGRFLRGQIDSPGCSDVEVTRVD